MEDTAPGGTASRAFFCLAAPLLLRREEVISVLQKSCSSNPSWRSGRPGPDPRRRARSSCAAGARREASRSALSRISIRGLSFPTARYRAGEVRDTMRALTEEGAMSVTTLSELFLKAASYNKPDCLLYKVGGTYQPVSTAELVDRVRRLAKALEELGVAAGRPRGADGRERSPLAGRRLRHALHRRGAGADLPDPAPRPVVLHRQGLRRQGRGGRDHQPPRRVPRPCRRAARRPAVRARQGRLGRSAGGHARLAARARRRRRSPPASRRRPARSSRTTSRPSSTPAAPPARPRGSC